jgi:hypothetical protein
MQIIEIDCKLSVHHKERMFAFRSASGFETSEQAAPHCRRTAQVAHLRSRCRLRKGSHCFLQDDRTEGPSAALRRASPIKHFRCEPELPELHTDGTAFGSRQPIRFLFRHAFNALSSASLICGLCNTAVHDMSPEHKQIWSDTRFDCGGRFGYFEYAV